MSSPFLGQILTSMFAGEPVAGRGRKSAAAPDAPLEPMEAGAWAAWAQAARDDAAAVAAQRAASPIRKERHSWVAQGLHR